MLFLVFSSGEHVPNNMFYPLLASSVFHQKKLFFISRQNTLVELPVTIADHVAEEKENTEV